MHRDEATLLDIATAPRLVLEFTKGMNKDAFVVVVFQGYHGYMGYPVEVRRIVQRDGTLMVYARFTEPAYGVPVAPLPTSPYAAVEVEKPAGLDSDVQVVLKINTVKTRS